VYALLAKKVLDENFRLMDLVNAGGDTNLRHSKFNESPLQMAKQHSLKSDSIQALLEKGARYHFQLLGLPVSIIQWATELRQNLLPYRKDDRRRHFQRRTIE
jgi:hypothetical protein